MHMRGQLSEGEASRMKPRARSQTTLQQQRRRFIAAMILPATVLVIAVTLGPAIWSIGLSFTNYSPLTPSTSFVGLANYLQILHDSSFWHSLWLTVLFTVLAVLLETVLGVGFAMLLHEEARGANVLRTIYLLPMVVTPVAATFMFMLILDPSLGVANYFVELLGGRAVSWLANPHIALFVLIGIDAWQWTPLILIIVSGALTALPLEPYEAAKVDGATGWQTARYLTLPLLRPYIGIAVTLRAMDAFKTFDIIYVLTGGGPGTSTRTLNLYAYKQGIEYLNMGYAAAISVVMLAATIITARVFLGRTNLFAGGDA